MQILKAGVLYFALVFGAGFMLDPFAHSGSSSTFFGSSHAAESSDRRG